MFDRPYLEIVDLVADNHCRLLVNEANDKIGQSEKHDRRRAQNNTEGAKGNLRKKGRQRNGK